MKEVLLVYYFWTDVWHYLTNSILNALTELSMKKLN